LSDDDTVSTSRPSVLSWLHCIFEESNEVYTIGKNGSNIGTSMDSAFINKLLGRPTLPEAQQPPAADAEVNST